MSNNLQPLLDVIYKLTSEDGCPWDKEQTHASLRTDLLEEAYEVVGAIDSDDMENLQEELGDLLFHIAFQTVLAEKENAFIFSDVLNDIVAKMIRRHPHVFSDVDVQNTSEVLTMWDEIKQEEKATVKTMSLADEIPHSMQDLIRLDKVIRKTTKQRIVLNKEEIVTALVESFQTNNRNYGEVLLMLAALAQCDGVHLDQALGKALSKYENNYDLLIMEDKEKVDFLTFLSRKQG